VSSTSWDRRTNRRQARCDEIGQFSWICNIGRERLQIVREHRRQRHDVLKIALDVALERIDLEMILFAQDFFSADHGAPQVGTGLDDPFQPHARQPLDDQAEAAVRQLEHLVNVGRGADRVEILEHRLFDRGVALGEYANHTPRRGGLVDQAHGGFPRDRERHERIRKEHCVP